VAISGQRSGERAGNGAPRPVASIPVSEERFDVVLVDDAPEVRQVVAQALRLSGRFTVVAEGESGRDAIDLVARHQPALLLLDASMPGMDGLESIPGVRLASPGTRIVMLSGFDAPGLQSKAIELGADAYVEKAKPLRELAPALLALLAGAAVGEQEPPPGDEGVLDEHLERFRTVFEQAAIGMATLTLTGRIVRANRALAALVGGDERSLVGAAYSTVATAAARTALDAAIGLVAGGRAPSTDLEHEVRPGQWARTTIAAVEDSRGRALYLFAQAEDITDRRRTMEQLRSSEERFRAIVEGVQDYAIFMLDPDGNVATWNKGAERIKGYRADEIIGRHFSTFYPEEAKAVHHPEHELEIAVREGRYEEEGWRVRKDGSLFWANVVITALFGQDGNLRGFAKVTRDMTDRRRAQQALLESEERFRLMVESVQDYAIFMLDADGHVATWNLGAERMKGYRADEIIGRHFRTFYTEDAKAIRHPEHELEIAVREGRYEEEGWRVRKDGSLFWANVVITALSDHDGKHFGFAKVTRDMTDRRRAQVEQERAAAHLEITAAELAEANKGLQTAAERIEEFVAVTAHELQSPVSAITGAADILLEYWDQLDPAERRDTLGHISRGGLRIRRLLNDLLTASRLDAGAFELKPETVELEGAVKEALAEAVAAGVTVAVDPGISVRADRVRVVQVVTNLVSNAVKYGRPPVVVEATTVPDGVEIRVRDHGKGLSAELAPAVFEKFVRGSGVGNRGTGLGLFIVRELARRQGGEAWYEPNPAGGACFAVRFPAA